jgi:uncharacterized membrane protein
MAAAEGTEARRASEGPCDAYRVPAGTERRLRVNSHNRMHLPQFFISLILIVVFGFSLVVVSAEETGTLILTIYPDGYVMVDMYYQPQEAPGNITVPLLGQPVYYGAEQGGLILPVEVGGSALTVSYYTSSVVHVYYLTGNLTSKTGAQWILQYNSPLPTIVVLPEGIVPVDVSPSDVAPILYNGTPALEFPPGSVRLTYLVLPQAPGSAAQTSSQEAPASPSSSTGQARGGHSALAWAVAGAAVAAGAAAAALLARRRRSAGNPGGQVAVAASRLDERDRAILDFLRNHGPATAQEIMDATGIPRTPLYRRLRKLEEMGLVEHIDEPGGGPRLYQLRGSPS